MHAGQVRRASAMDCRGEVRAGLSVDGAVPCRSVLTFMSDKACNERASCRLHHNAPFVFMGTTMITVHHLNDSRSQRVLWLLEELGVPYEVKRYERNKQTMLAPPALARVHPLGKSPVIEDEGRVIAETGAIVSEHLPGTVARAEHFPSRNRILAGLSLGTLVGVLSGMFGIGSPALRPSMAMW